MEVKYAGERSGSIEAHDVKIMQSKNSGHFIANPLAMLVVAPHTEDGEWETEMQSKCEAVVRQPQADG